MLIKMRIFGLLFVLLCFCNSSSAQDRDSLPFLYRPVFAIKFVPLPLIARTPAIQFAVEARTFKNQAIQLEYGYVRDFYDTFSSTFNGYKLKTEYRFYLGKGRKAIQNYFLGLQYHRKILDVKGDATLWRDNRNYQEIVQLELRNETNSFFLMGGQVFPVADHLFIELALGVGVRTLEVSLEEIPEDAELATSLQENIFNPVSDVGTYTYPRLFISLKVNYAFGRR